MPLGILRLNAQKTQPNNRIAFVKPLKGQDEAIAQDFLERIAAQCLPIMREHHLSLTTLEEYEPNREFVGRNFNGGEIIQLVLKARSGHWLPFNYVQMVMMHELAHCVQMNHSRAFWKVRNTYAEQMRTLWASAYTGEGMWGRGALLGSGEFEDNAVVAGEDMPEHLCGGTYRSRRRKRKGAPELSYQEKKQRRIEKKFGKNGVALGADDAVKAKLEKGTRTPAAPRVAGSNRGRELRAAAALARFEEKKQEPEHKENEESNDESDYDDAEDVHVGADDAVDIDGKKLRDPKGNRMVKVCEDENPDDEDAANELQELQSSMTAFFSPREDEDSVAKPGRGSRAGHSTEAQDRSRDSNLGVTDNTTMVHKQQVRHQARSVASKTTRDTTEPLEFGSDKNAPPKSGPALGPQPDSVKKGASCRICSYKNDAYTVTCGMCSNVLDPDSVPGTWSCHSSSCKGSDFVNAGDCGTCCVCGERRGAAGYSVV
ncbi:unnamed protein product [Discula destructiva]